MTYPTHLLTNSLAALGLVLSGSAWASSTAGSSASSAGSMSLKGSSASIEGSSGVVSSGGGDKTALVHDGDYRITATDAPDTLRLTLAPQHMNPAAQAFVLRVPTAAFPQKQPQAGEVVQALHRDYGVQFTHAEQPFLLVLADAWHSELDSRPITP